MGNTLANPLSSDKELKISRQLIAYNEELTRNNISNDKKYESLVEKYNELSKLYSLSSYQVPHVRFGRTELMMPIITCGGMRQQETWMNDSNKFSIENINKENHKNFELVIQRAMELGINHFETARGYGSSETQFGDLLKKYSRSSYILQSKCAPKANFNEFREILEKTFTELQLTNDNDYLDLFSFHGINRPEHLQWIIQENGCLDVVREYQAKGKIKYIGFSSHGTASTILQAIRTNIFDYVNLHYHFVGSYTATGTGSKGFGGNQECVEEAMKHDMGVFIISGADKGGNLYEPSKYLYRECLPYTPIAFNSLWLWSQPGVHTIVVGAARPSDFDEAVQAAMSYNDREAISTTIANKLYKRVEDLFGSDFLTNWYIGIPDAFSNVEGLPIAKLFWLWWLTKAWGLHGFAVKRYAGLESNLLKEWKDDISYEENSKLFNWVPGISFRPEREDQLRNVLQGHPKQEQIINAIKELHSWVEKGGIFKNPNQIPLNVTNEEIEDWKMAFDLQPWVPFCQR